jgi:LysR family transcriptional activator of nhaA
MLGEELNETLADPQLDKTIRLSAGVSDVLPKTIAMQLLQPALQLDRKVRLSCNEGDFEELLTNLGSHKLDLILADRPVTAGSQQQFQSWMLASCPVMIFGVTELCGQYRPGFPASLDKAPFLLPSRDNILRRQLEHWFEENRIKPDVVGEFDDGALLEAFGQQGLGLFPAPALSSTAANLSERLGMVGEAGGVREHYYVIASRRKLQHPALQAITAHGVASQPV